MAEGGQSDRDHVLAESVVGEVRARAGAVDVVAAPGQPHVVGDGAGDRCGRAAGGGAGDGDVVDAVLAALVHGVAGGVEQRRLAQDPVQNDCHAPSVAGRRWAGKERLRVRAARSDGAGGPSAGSRPSGSPSGRVAAGRRSPQPRRSRVAQALSASMYSCPSGAHPSESRVKIPDRRTATRSRACRSRRARSSLLPCSERSRRRRSGELPRRKRSGRFVASICEVAALYRLSPAIWGSHPETSYSC